MRHTNDLTSVCAWIEEMASLKYNPVFIYKQQGLEQPEDINDVSNEDFLLGIRTEFQRDIMKRFGSETICIDVTHGTNMYDFNLLTVIVIDDYGEGIPVAWMVSNREDSMLLIQFFRALKCRVGSIEPKWFMSDDADQYFNAWKAVFGAIGTNKLLCAWHIDRSWRHGLKDHILGKEEQINMYHHLCALLTEREESNFRLILQEVLTYANNYHPKFHTYFKNNYCSRLQQWASCFRTHTTVNTNMFLEAFHRTLKVVYLKHKQNRRIDFLLTTLLRIARDKTFKRLYKLEKGKNTHRICEINKRHKTAQEMKLACTEVTPVGTLEWRVQSQHLIQFKDY